MKKIINAIVVDCEPYHVQINGKYEELYELSLIDENNVKHSFKTNIYYKKGDFAKIEIIKNHQFDCEYFALKHNFSDEIED